MSDDDASFSSPKATAGELAVRLRDVFFAYERDADLGTTSASPDSSGAADDTDAAADTDDAGALDSPDPDARGGPVLRGFDLDVPAGSFTVVMGASGGGKSTLLRTFNAIIPDFFTGSFAGELRVLDRDATATRVAELAEVVGIVLQDYESQLFGTSVTAEVAFGPENFGVPASAIDERIDRSLSLVDLDHLPRHRSPGNLSGGQKQRLVFASVLATHPELLALDEPTSDLDPAGSHEVLELIRDLAVERVERTTDAPDDTDDDAGDGSPAPETIVMVTHEIEEALLADRAVLLRGGRVFREGTVRGVFTDPDDLRAASVAVPPIVEAFDRLSWPEDDLPLTVDEALDRLGDVPLEWTPPATSADPERQRPGAPAGTGVDPGDPVFELDGVTYEYETDRGPIRAVDDVDLTVCEGEAVAIVGHNGSGKTTLAKHLNGLLAPDDGSVRWNGREVSELSMSEVGQSVGFVFQNPDHQIFASTVVEEVAFGPENFGIRGEPLDCRVAEAIETVELDGLEETDPFALSKGQRQRVALASILATDPDTIVFDEPATGLDAAQQSRFLDLVARLNRDDDVTVVVVTHDMTTVARYTPRTVVLADGRKVADRSTRELFADERALGEWELAPPHTVALSNRLAEDPAPPDEPVGLPALSVDELVAGLGGEGAAREAATERDRDDRPGAVGR